MNILIGIILIIFATLIGVYLFRNPIPKEDDTNLHMIQGVVGIVILIVVGIILIFK